MDNILTAWARLPNDDSGSECNVIEEYRVISDIYDCTQYFSGGYCGYVDRLENVCIPQHLGA